MLTSKTWITPAGVVELKGASEHEQLAAAVMLRYPEPIVPNRWIINGVPEAELDAARARDADPKAVTWLYDKKDARLYALREYGWVRTFKAKWNCWRFDCETAAMVNKSGYWDTQYSLDKYDMIDVEEFDGHDRYSINAMKIIDGADPTVLKNLARGRLAASDKEEAICPSYSTAKYSELEREKLYGRTGANPRRRRR